MRKRLLWRDIRYWLHMDILFVSRDYDKLVENAQAKGCKIAMYGHTHMPVIENEDGILVINPGSLTYPRQRGRRPSYAVMQIEEGKDPQVEIRYL